MRDHEADGKPAFVYSESTLSVGALLKETSFGRVCAYGIGQLPEDAVVKTDGNVVKAVFQNCCRTVLTTFD